MTRDGVVLENQTTGEEINISDREAEQDFLNIQSKCNKTKGEKKNGQPKGKPVNWKLARTTRKE